MKGKKHRILIFGNGGCENLAENLSANKSYEVFEASKIPETLTALIEMHFDLVLILDENLEKDAIKLCRIIKSHQSFRFLPVLYIANTFSKDFLIQAYEAGADEYLEQTCDPVELKDRIDLKLILCDRKRMASPQFRYHKHKLRLISDEIETIKKELINQKNTAMEPDDKNQKMDIGRLKGYFLQVMVQELRSPVSAIIGFTDILKDKEDKGEKVHLVNSLDDASRKTRELLDLALAITEINPENSTSKMRPYKVSSLVDYAIDDHDELIRDKHIIISRPDDLEMTEVVIDPGLIKEVVRIFIYNAIWHTPEKGQLKISVNESVDKVELYIEDTGDGFKQEDLNNINHFLSIPSVASRSDWPGLRFAVAKFIMDIHHATIKVKNNTQGGASAKLIFPVNNAQREALHQLLSQLN